MEHGKQQVGTIPPRARPVARPSGQVRIEKNAQLRVSEAAVSERLRNLPWRERVGLVVNAPGKENRQEDGKRRSESSRA
jgi:hypothetical protein